MKVLLLLSLGSVTLAHAQALGSLNINFAKMEGQNASAALRFVPDPTVVIDPLGLGLDVRGAGRPETTFLESFGWGSQGAGLNGPNGRIRSTPEPFTMGLCFAGVGLFLRRRKKSGSA